MEQDCLHLKLKEEEGWRPGEPKQQKQKELRMPKKLIIEINTIVGKKNI